jgi:hypothetical protein
MLLLACLLSWLHPFGGFRLANFHVRSLLQLHTVSVQRIQAVNSSKSLGATRPPWQTTSSSNSKLNLNDLLPHLRDIHIMSLPSGSKQSISNSTTITISAVSLALQRAATAPVTLTERDAAALRAFVARHCAELSLPVLCNTVWCVGTVCGSAGMRAGPAGSTSMRARPAESFGTRAGPAGDALGAAVVSALGAATRAPPARLAGKDLVKVFTGLARAGAAAAETEAEERVLRETLSEPRGETQGHFS